MVRSDRRALINGRVFDGTALHRDLTVILEQGRIVELLPATTALSGIAEKTDLGGHMLAPGLNDIHVNGGGGVLFNDEPTVDGIRRIGAAHRKFGTTGFMPTLISCDTGTMRRAVSAVEQAIEEGVPGVLGLHLEGPFLNAEYRGVHNADWFCQIDDEGFELLTSLNRGRMLVTIAPELTSVETISRLTDRGILLFVGHCSATYDQTRDALRAGVRGFTHLFNAMPPLQSRAPGVVGAALEDRESWCGIIADGHHLHPATLAVAVAAKPRGRMVLVSDAMPTVGSETTVFHLEGEEIVVAEGCCRTRSGRLAGSDLDMISAVRNTIRFTAADRFEALRMASTYPAAALGLETELGYIRPGFRANLLELDDELNIHRTWIDGEEQWK